MNEKDLVRRLIAKLESSVLHVPMGMDTAGYLVKLLGKPILQIINEQVAEDRRARRKDVQE